MTSFSTALSSSSKSPPETGRSDARNDFSCESCMTVGWEDEPEDRADDENP
jgi:hypothetical protein